MLSAARMQVVQRRVWIDDWQMECCGEHLRVGQHVDLTVTTAVAVDRDREYLGAVLGDDRAATVTDYEEHHDLDGGLVSLLSGIVETIEAISCAYELRGETWCPVPGKTHVDQREEATGWESGEGSVRFVGYVVTLSTR